MLLGNDRARTGRRLRLPGVLLAALAAAWIGGGLVEAFAYVNNYSQHRGFAVLHRARGVRAGRMVWMHFYSHAMGREADYLVYLPTGYDPAKRYPAFYLLHGLPGRPQAYIRIGSIDVRLDNLIAKEHLPPMILVFPDGRIGGATLSDSEWANTSAGRFADYVVEVVHAFDHSFPTVADRQHRVIGGYSAGGYGAINIALRHPDVFGSVQVWSGYFVQTRSGVFDKASTQDLWDNSPADYVPYLRPELRRDPIRTFLFCGRGDRNHVVVQPMSAELKAAGATASWAIYPGGHDWQLWHAHLDQMLRLASRDFNEPLEPVASPPNRGPPRSTGSARRAGTGHARPTVRGRRRTNSRGGSRSRLGRRLTPLGRLGSTPGGRSGRPPGPSLGPASLQESAFALPRHPRLTPPGLTGGMALGLLLALLSAAAINLGFLLQHRGLRVRPGGGRWALIRALMRSRAWLSGQAVGNTGFLVQLLAVGLAPLALVQAFAAGGLALSVPIASRFFDHRVTGRATAAVLAVAGALAVLPLGLAHEADRLHPGLLLAVMAAAAALGIALAALARPPARAAAAGVFYGVADCAIKAVAVRWPAHGAGALLSGWMAIAAGGTFAGFLAFQTSLRGGSAISGISLMNVFAALTAVVGAISAFGEPLGRGEVAILVHVAAIVLVLACVPILASVQLELAEAQDDVLLPAPGDQATHGQQPGFEPRSGAGGAGAEDVAQRLVAGHRVGELGEQPQNTGAEQPAQDHAGDPWQAPQAYSGHHAGG